MRGKLLVTNLKMGEFFHMKTTSRRSFITQTGAFLAAAPFVARSVESAANRVVLGFIGPGGQGTNLLQSFGKMKDVEIAAVCDVDRKRADAAARMTDKLTGHAPKTVSEMRELIANKDIDAVVIGTPDHWHAPATILACDAGKHVYVEKPCSHNIREGRLMLEAARRNKRIVQVGTQSRSAPHLREGIERLKNGAIGEILVAKSWNSQLRGNIGKRQPSPPPPELDYDSWVGPAPMRPYQSNLLHGSWRWFFDFGCGDMGNDGVHDIDIARWGLGVETHPSRISAMGGKYFFDDDQEFPDTQNVLFEYDSGSGKKKQLIYEQRLWSPYVQENNENGNAFYGTKGMMILGKHRGWEIFGPRNEPGEKMLSSLDPAPHHRDFLERIRDGKHPNGDVEVGHLSATLVHLGNIATRLGRTLKFDPAKEQILDDSEANAMVRRKYRDHWAVPKNV
jgi:predicted dehydrogenase